MFFMQAVYQDRTSNSSTVTVVNRDGSSCRSKYLYMELPFVTSEMNPGTPLIQFQRCEEQWFITGCVLSKEKACSCFPVWARNNKYSTQKSTNHKLQPKKQPLKIGSKVLSLRGLLPKPEPPGLWGLKLLIFNLKLKELPQTESVRPCSTNTCTFYPCALGPPMSKTPSYHH